VYLTAYLAEELAEMTRRERADEVARSRLALLADCARRCRDASSSMVERFLAVLWPAPRRCSQA